MILDKHLLDSLTDQAQKSSRLRFAYDLRTSPSDTSQRMLNAIEPGSVVPIHRHCSSSETCIILRGKAEELFYDDNGIEVERTLLEPWGSCSGVNIEKGCWHKIVALESGTIIFESKDGSYEPLSPNELMRV